MYLHRLIIGDKPGYIIDHINRDTLDNRKGNLRHATKAENAWNRKTPALGVTWVEKDKRWMAQIKYRNKHIYLGYYKIKEAAIQGRKAAEQKYWNISR